MTPALCQIRKSDTHPLLQLALDFHSIENNDILQLVSSCTFIENTQKHTHIERQALLKHTFPEATCCVQNSSFVFSFTSLFIQPVSGHALFSTVREAQPDHLRCSLRCAIEVFNSKQTKDDPAPFSSFSCFFTVNQLRYKLYRQIQFRKMLGKAYAPD